MFLHYLARWHTLLIVRCSYAQSSSIIYTHQPEMVTTYWVDNNVLSRKAKTIEILFPNQKSNIRRYRDCTFLKLSANYKISFWFAERFDQEYLGNNYRSIWNVCKVCLAGFNTDNVVYSLFREKTRSIIREICSVFHNLFVWGGVGLGLGLGLGGWGVGGLGGSLSLCKKLSKNFLPQLCLKLGRAGGWENWGVYMRGPQCGPHMANAQWSKRQRPVQSVLT